jgi:hypothetical protein
MYLLGDFQLISNEFIIHEMSGHFTKFNKSMWDVINLFLFLLQSRAAGHREAALQKAANYSLFGIEVSFKFSFYISRHDDA